MSSAESILQELSKSAGFKKYFKGGFGKHAKHAEDIWRGAEEKGVFEVTQIGDFTTTGVGKVIYAFTTDGSALPGDVFGELSARAAGLTPDQIAAEDRNWLISIEPLTPPAGHPNNKKGDAPFLIYHIADGFPNVRTFLHSSLFFSPKDMDASSVACVLYARKGKDEYIAVLERRQIK